MNSGRIFGAGLYVWAAVGWALRTVGYVVGEAIDAACELFDLDGEDHVQVRPISTAILKDLEEVGDETPQA